MNKMSIWRRCRIILFDMHESGEYRGHCGRILTVIMDREEIGLRGGCGERAPSFVGTFYALPFIYDWSLQSRIVRPLVAQGFARRRQLRLTCPHREETSAFRFFPDRRNPV
ncbi:hypothetical protein [uncultured Bifidobacterium sp.]|uniref:hypothetical protein n=1 Tax=uncultured Bifidobacterium sp. TaxID=165187 RepID=UPI0026372D4A|nr:hypothetical protein [uncultured Bifidobacterium sp.]